MVRHLLMLNYHIVFDADSRAAPFIAALVGQNGVGISIGEKKVQLDTPVIRFQNPYHKFFAMRHAAFRIVDPQLTTGLGLFLTGDASLILDADKSWPGGIENWDKELKNNGLDIGLKLEIPRRFASVSEISSLFKAHKAKPAPGFIKEQKLNISQLMTFATIEGYAFDGKDARRFASAAILGSSGLHQRFVSYTDHLGLKNGPTRSPARTGGAGGLMLAANMGAFDVGGMSIGVPRIWKIQRTRLSFRRTFIRTRS